MSTPDPTALQAYTDADNAFSIAAKLWATAPLKPTPEAFQATVATVMIHMKELRRTPTPQVHPQAGQSRAAVPARPAPAPAASAPVDAVPACPTCGGEMWDNREGKKNPKAPDFKCRDKNCLDAKGMVTALWVRDLKKNTAFAQAAAIRNTVDSFADMPAALQSDESDTSLPF